MVTNRNSTIPTVTIGADLRVHKPNSTSRLPKFKSSYLVLNTPVTAVADSQRPIGTADC